MKASELRIGNFIHGIVDDEYGEEKEILVKVVALDSVGVTEHPIWVTPVDPKESQEEYYDAMDPIPLTEEWLLRLGYTPCSFVDNNYITIGHVIWKCNESFLCDKNGVVITYVHQLQNLYYALTGEEIKLKNK